MAIQFFSEDISFKLKNKKDLKIWLKSIIETENKKTGQINIIFCSDAFLFNLNTTFLQHDTFTDIITFPYSESSDKNISGEIYISIERVEENASLFKASFSNETHRVMAHGVLHLLGYKDKTKNEKTNMRAKEDLYLSLLSEL